MRWHNHSQSRSMVSFHVQRTFSWKCDKWCSSSWKKRCDGRIRRSLCARAWNRTIIGANEMEVNDVVWRWRAIRRSSRLLVRLVSLTICQSINSIDVGVHDFDRSFTSVLLSAKQCDFVVCTALQTVRTGAREPFFNRGSRSIIKFYHVTWYVDFYPTCVVTIEIVNSI